MDSLEIKNVNLMQYDKFDGLLERNDQEKSKEINFSYDFQNIPQVLIVVSSIDFLAQGQAANSFSMIAENITNKGFTIKTSKIGDGVIFGLQIKYLAIDQKDVYITQGSINMAQNQVSKSSNQITTKVTYPYKRQIQDTNKTKRIICIYLTGLHQLNPESMQQDTKVSVIFNVVENLNDFDIFIASNEVRENLVFINFNYIEIYEDLQQGYYKFIAVDESHLFRQPNNDLAKALVYNSVKIPSIDVKINTIESIFFGLTSLEGIVGQVNIRLVLSTGNIQNNMFDFEYITWEGTKVLSVSSIVLAFLKRKCSSEPINKLYDEKNKQCLDKCKSGYFILYDKQLNGQKCEQCHTSCKECSGEQDNNCTQCFQNKYLFKGKCVDQKPDKTYCNPQTLQCFECKQGCQECLNDIECTICEQNYTYKYKNLCYKQKPEQTFCDPHSFNCTECPNACKECNQFKQCTKCLNINHYLLEGNCIQNKPQLKLFCTNQMKCIQCNPNCSNCQNQIDNCSQCKIQFNNSLFDNLNTNCLNPQYNNQSNQMCQSFEQQFNQYIIECNDQESSSMLNKERMSIIKPASTTISYASISTTFFLTFSQGFSGSGTSFLQQFLIIQKLLYLLLIDSPIPQNLFDFLYSLTKGNPLQQMQKTGKCIINYILPSTNQYEKETLGAKFEDVGIASSISENIIFGVLMFISIFMINMLFIKLRETRYKSRVTQIYEQVLSSYISQNIQLLTLVFWFGLLIQLLQIISDSNFNHPLLLSTFLIIGSILTTVLYIFQTNLFNMEGYYGQNNVNQIQLSNYTIMKLILKKNIQNNCITRTKYQNIYMLIFTTMEILILPLFMVVQYKYYISQLTLFGIFQVGELAITSYLRPFQQRRDNIQFIFEQSVWVIVFCLYAPICILSNHKEKFLDQQEYLKYMDVLTILIMIFVIILVLINPFVMIFKFIEQIYTFIKNKIRDRNTKQITFTDLEYSKQIIQTQLIPLQEIKKYKY